MGSPSHKNTKQYGFFMFVFLLVEFVSAAALLVNKYFLVPLSSLSQSLHVMMIIVVPLDSYGYGSIPIDTFLVGWTSIYQLFWYILMFTRGTRFWHTAICWFCFNLFSGYGSVSLSFPPGASCVGKLLDLLSSKDWEVSLGCHWFVTNVRCHETWLGIPQIWGIKGRCAIFFGTSIQHDFQWEKTHPQIMDFEIFWIAMFDHDRLLWTEVPLCCLVGHFIWSQFWATTRTWILCFFWLFR